jgi:hypothetical protein
MLVACSNSPLSQEHGFKSRPGVKFLGKHGNVFFTNIRICKGIELKTIFKVYLHKNHIFLFYRNFSEL